MGQYKEPIHKYIDGIRYHVTDIGDLPGVTTVLGETKDKRFLAKWKARIGADVADGIFKNSTTRGNQLHATIEAFLLDTPPEKVNQQTIKLWKLVRPLIEDLKANATDLYVEAPTYSKLGYAGTPDLVCKYKDEFTVFDWKNSRKPKTRSSVNDYLKQVAAYAKSHEEIYGNVVTKGIVVVSVLPDQYLAHTDPGKVVEPELQMFEMKAKSIETHFKGFKKRLNEFVRLRDLDNWFDDDDDTVVIW